MCNVLRTSWHSQDLCLPLLGLFTPQKEFGLFTLSQTVTQTHSPRGTGCVCVYMYMWLYAAMSEHLPVERGSLMWDCMAQLLPGRSVGRASRLGGGLARWALGTPTQGLPSSLTDDPMSGLSAPPVFPLPSPAPDSCRDGSSRVVSWRLRAQHSPSQCPGL